MRFYFPRSIRFVLLLAVLTTGCDFLGFGENDSDDGPAVLVTERIPSQNAPRGAFLTKTVTLDVPDEFSQIVFSRDREGKNHFSVDDWVNLTITGPDDTVQEARLSENTASGDPVGEQWILTNVADLVSGQHSIEVEFWNEFTPSGNNAGASETWIVVVR